MSNVSLYIDYFRQLAVRHAELQHNPLSETGDGPAEEQHFGPISVDEVAKNILYTKGGFPCLFLQLYETSFDSPSPYDVRQNPEGAFLLLDHPTDSTFAAQTACFVRTERIVNDLLRQIYQDHYAYGVERCHTPFREFFFDQVTVVPVGPVCGGEYGYWVRFNFQLQNKFDIATAPAPGRFLAPPSLLHQDNSYLLNNSNGKLPVS